MYVQNWMINELKYKILCKKYADDVYRFSRSMLRNASDAEDATQEVFLRFWKNIHKINPIQGKAWLMKTTRNYCLDVVRRRSNQLVLAGGDDEFPIQNLESGDGDPIQSCTISETREMIDKALGSLPENLRLAFVLYEINGLKYREISDVTGQPINSVKVNISRARGKLRDWISSQNSNVVE